MRFFMAFLVLFLIGTLPVHAQTVEKCEGLDMSDPAAIVACLESDETWFAARTKPQFEPNQKCAFMQYMTVKISLSATDSAAAKRINSKSLENSDMPRPSCETLSEVVELIHGRPASWSACLGYDEAEDKFEHFKYCITKYQQLRYNQPGRGVGKMDCKRAVATYQQALSSIYLPRRDQGEYYGKAVPSTYTAPDCAQVDAFFQAAYEVEMAALEKRHQEQMVLKAQRKAEKEAKAKEAAENAKRFQEYKAKMEESYQNSLDKMNEPALNRMKNEEQPKDKIDNTYIRHALIREVWDMVPESRHKMGTTVVKLIHTTAGFKSWTNSKMAPNLYHAVKNATIQSCDIKGSKAHCVYDVTVSSSIDFHGIGNSDKRNVYNMLGGAAGGGPRTFTLESDFSHDGKRWKVELTYEQAKQLLPPEAKYDADRAAQDREKMNCDMMSAMGVPVMC